MGGDKAAQASFQDLFHAWPETGGTFGRKRLVPRSALFRRA